MSVARFAAYDAATGAPLAGLAPSWVAAYDVGTGAVLTPAAPTEIGGGEYRCDPGATGCGMVDLTAAASPRYVFIGNDGATILPAFAAADGTPLAGLAPTWESYRDATTGAAILPQATFTELGHGMYRVDNLDANAAGIVDFGATAAPRYVELGDVPSTDTTPPSVANLVPAAGSVLQRYDTIGLDVTDAGSGLRLVMLVAQFAGLSQYEVVHDGTAFAPNYSGGSTRTVIANGYTYVLSRVGGWPAAVTLTPFAVDQAGNENT